MNTISLEEFYQDTETFLPTDISQEIGHFNVFEIAKVRARMKDKPEMPYNKRAYYKISLIKGKNRVEYADKVITIDKDGLLFATPKVPYHYIPQDNDQSGMFCVFTGEFLTKSKSGIVLDNLPLRTKASTRHRHLSRPECFGPGNLLIY